MLSWVFTGAVFLTANLAGSFSMSHSFEARRVHVRPNNKLDDGVGASRKAADFLDVSPRMKVCRVRRNLDVPRLLSLLVQMNQKTLR
jgi:hypothetical protein